VAVLAQMSMAFAGIQALTFTAAPGLNHLPGKGGRDGPAPSRPPLAARAADTFERLVQRLFPSG
jgi:hypothetical protein